MFRLKQQLLTLAAAVVLAVGFISGASAQSLKIGYIKNDEIIKSYKAWQRAQEQFEIEKKTWDSTAQERANELRTMYEEYEKQRLILSDEKKRERETVIRQREDELNKMTQQIYGPEGTAERKQAELVNPLLENISKAMEQLAIDEGYDIIFTSQAGVGYIKPQYDVTAKVLEYLDKLEK